LRQELGATRAAKWFFRLRDVPQRKSMTFGSMQSPTRPDCNCSAPVAT